MLGKKEIKDIQSLDLKKFRDNLGKFVAEGPKIIRELLQEQPALVQKIYATAAWIEENKSLVAPFVQQVSDSELQQLSHLKTPNQVLAVVKQPPSPEPAAVDALCLYLDTIQDPGNLGTILRCADWFGIQQVVCSAGCADLYNAKVVQASMASIWRVPVFYEKDNSWIERQKVPIYAATVDGQPLQAFRKITKGILVIGNESKGIRPALLQQATHHITIPRRGAAESLNAAVATGILLSHLVS